MCRNRALPVIFCGCETRSVTLREEHKLRVFENLVVRNVFGTTREEVAGKWRELHVRFSGLRVSLDVVWLVTSG
jgi:hypothetical protein